MTAAFLKTLLPAPPSQDPPPNPSLRKKRSPVSGPGCSQLDWTHSILTTAVKQGGNFPFVPHVLRQKAPCQSGCTNEMQYSLKACSWLPSLQKLEIRSGRNKRLTNHVPPNQSMCPKMLFLEYDLQWTEDVLNDTTLSVPASTQEHRSSGCSHPLTRRRNQLQTRHQNNHDSLLFCGDEFLQYTDTWVRGPWKQTATMSLKNLALKFTSLGRKEN